MPGSRSLAVEGSTTTVRSLRLTWSMFWCLLHFGRVSGSGEMDNTSALTRERGHKGERVKELIESKGCELIYLYRPTRLTSTL